jgi:hypothetical protein
MTERRDAPWPLRIPNMPERKEQAVAIAKWKGQPSAHALLVSYVVEGLDQDLKAMTASQREVSPRFRKGGK